MPNTYKKLIVAFSSVILLILSANTAKAQKLADDFVSANDSLTVLLKERTTVSGITGLKNVMKRGKYIDFYFNSALGDFPWHKEDIKWFKNELENQLPESCRNFKIGKIFCNKMPLEQFATAHLGFDGNPSGKKEISDPRKKNFPMMVRNIHELEFEKGLDGRYIAMWQSHGRYYNEKNNRWQWQRAPVFRTVEDMYTQSYVLPFLIPMLENAGAYVMTPRERDTQVYEAVVDNDPSFEGERTGLLRRSGTYSEKGNWENGGTGFADAKEIYSGTDNPFQMGSYRMTKAVSGKSKNKATAKWTPNIPKDGRYAVYISYKSLPNSTSLAHYTVRHAGGRSEFAVNQKLGGGTWIYLGTFDFEKGEKGYVALSNAAPGRRKSADKNSVVTADGVRFGGGIGKIARGKDNMLSGMPCFTEGAIYSMQWGGCDSTLYKKHDDEYTNDYATRGPWVSMMAGGSRVNPLEKGKKIPFDLSFAFHSDAGTTPNDSIIGTLAIYTLKCEGSRKFPNGENRITSRTLTDLVQSQVVKDVRSIYEPEWSRRFTWDRSYSESRTPNVPAMLLEFLSHQNFADMKYGLDPAFRFTVSRSIYKGMLKYLSNRYGCPYVVQPLPVKDMAVTFKSLDNAHATENIFKAELSWRETRDTLEQTADPEGYILYTKVDNGAFDNGRILKDYSRKEGRVQIELPIDKGHIYSYKIVAYNEGGKSFPSEVLSIGLPSKLSAPASRTRAVMVVNNFDRVSSPTWFDTPEYAGFNDELDGGVAYMNEINYIGSMYMFRRDFPWIDDDCPGFGASYNDFAGKVIKGNTFDYPLNHGESIMKAGYPFYSVSASTFASLPELGNNAFAADIICGKQVTVKVGRGVKPNKFNVFPVKLQKAIKNYTSKGGNILISGAHIGTDVWDKVFPVEIDSAYRANTKKFVKDVFGYKWRTNYASKAAKVIVYKNEAIDIPCDGAISYFNKPNEEIYCAETVDGLIPASEKSSIFLKYEDSLIPAGIYYLGNGYKSVSVGFPLELVKDKEQKNSIIKSILDFLAH